MNEKRNKAETTKRILELGTQIPCVKLEIKNIIFPKWNDLGLLGLMLRQCVVTKEQPEGQIYDEAKFLIIMRIINGQVLMNGRPDCYCWKLEKYLSLKEKKVIGSNSAEGMKNAGLILAEITDEDERTLFADMLASLKKDLIIAKAPKENRICIEITQEMYDLGITYCVDSWMEPDENGDAKITKLYVGDYLIVENQQVYRVGHDEFVTTYSIS